MRGIHDGVCRWDQRTREETLRVGNGGTQGGNRTGIVEVWPMTSPSTLFNREIESECPSMQWSSMIWVLWSIRTLVMVGVRA